MFLLDKQKGPCRPGPHDPVSGAIRCSDTQGATPDVRTRPTTGVGPLPMPSVAVTSERSFAQLDERGVMLGAAPRRVKRAGVGQATRSQCQLEGRCAARRDLMPTVITRRIASVAR